MPAFADAYVRRARIAPVLLILLPVLGGLFCDLVFHPDWQAHAGTGVVGLVGYTLLAQFDRDRGKRLEPKLYAQWGAKPTTRRLRHADDSLDPATKSRLHRLLGPVVPDGRLPTVEEEADDPAAADELYDSGVTWLRAQTADNDQFPRVHEENVSYGFRRNLLGLKPIGILLGIGLAPLWGDCTFGHCSAAADLPWRCRSAPGRQRAGCRFQHFPDARLGSQGRGCLR